MKSYVAKTSWDRLLIDTATYLLTINLPSLKSVAMSLYDITPFTYKLHGYNEGASTAMYSMVDGMCTGPAPLSPHTPTTDPSHPTHPQLAPPSPHAYN